MIVFAVAYGRGAREAAKAAATHRDALVGELGLLDRPVTGSWASPGGRAAVVWAAHRPEQLGGTEPVTVRDGRLALVAGRPILWETGDRADGRGAIDPATYLAPAAAWAPRLDGRGAVLAAGDARVDLVGDPAGAFPLFEAQAAGVRWCSGSAELLRRITGSTAVDDLALAGLLGGGWPLGGDPVWSAVRRLAAGTQLTLEGDRRVARQPAMAPAATAHLDGAGWDGERAAAVLVGAVRALADWPGRPSVVPVTGGRDSRVILAAALAAGIPFTAVTGGAPGEPDVEGARALCARAGVEHHLLGPTPGGDRDHDPVRAARTLMLQTAGTASLADAVGFPRGPAEGVLPLWHTGQAGELGRRLHGGTPYPWPLQAEWLLRRFTHVRPGRRRLLSRPATADVRRRLDAFARELRAAGAGRGAITDLFQLHERTASWAGPTHGCVEPMRDSTSPLWSVRLIPELLGAPAGLRRRQGVHRELVARLAPRLLDVPFGDGTGWGAPPGPVRVARRAARELGARRPHRPGPPPAPQAPVPAPAAAPAPPSLTALVRDAAGDRPGHPAWRVLDREAVLARLSPGGRPADAGDRQRLWWVATAVLGMPPD